MYVFGFNPVSPSAAGMMSFVLAGRREAVKRFDIPKQNAPGRNPARGVTIKKSGLLFLACKAGFLQGIENVLVIEIAGDIKGFRSFGGGIAGYAGHTT